MIRESILDVMKKKGHSQRWLAKRIGMAPQSLNNFLRGKRGLPFGKIEMAMEVLGLELVTKEEKERRAASPSLHQKHCGGSRVATTCKNSEIIAKKVAKKRVCEKKIYNYLKNR